MIQNESQYEITKREAERFRMAVKRLEIQKNPSVLVTAELAALKGQLGDLEREIAEWEGRDDVPES